MTTRKSVCGLLGLVVFIGVIAIFGGMKKSSAEVSVGINLNLGSPPQDVIMVPGGVYFVPEQDNVFFYGGFWWASRDNQWYRSRDYDRSWRVMDRRYVPRPVYQTYETPNYRDHYMKQDGKRVPYGQWKKGGKHDNRPSSGDYGDQGNQKGKSGKGKKGGH